MKYDRLLIPESLFLTMINLQDPQHIMIARHMLLLVFLHAIQVNPLHSVV